MGKVRDGRTSLYRHFGPSDELLYVGISLSAVARLEAHRNSSDWFGQITKITITQFGTREEAIAAEAIAINTEEPIYNRFKPSLTDYVASRPELKAVMALFDPNMCCPKCGCEDDLDLTWVPALADRAGGNLKWRSARDKREHLRRECNDCGFVWSEATLDSADERQPEAA